ncbi:MAG TPA: hypothetical protein VHV47_05460 [Opitutaceae bacterium]|jgi:hypothetical protein|nr:hypothetical protein [Opitutaceae bacterium]
MRRALLVLLTGLASGVGAHLGWFAAHRPARTGGLDTEIAWMKDTLDLTPVQVARIRALHEQSGPRLTELAAQAAVLRAQFADFEQQRRTVGQVDFLEFARYVDQRRTVDRECRESARQLVTAATAVMTNQQRALFLAWVGPALNSRRGDGVD